MSAKIVFVFCVQAVFIQSSLSQCTSRAAVADPGLYGYAAYDLNAPYGLSTPNVALPYGYAEPAYGAPCGLASPWTLPALEFSPTTGGALPISSSSPVPPTGISVVSDNIFEGPLTVAGELPFIGTVAMDGTLPTIGNGLINHACGNGVNAMVSEISAYAPGYAGAYDLGLAAPALGYNEISAYAPGYAGAYGAGIAAPALGYRAEWANKGCGCTY